MAPRAGTTLIVLLALLVPGAARGEDEAPALTPWAAVREALRGQKPVFRGGKERSLHECVPAAVEAALAWLAAHQSPDGRWEAAGFGRWCDGEEVPEGERADGPGLAIYDVGVTGLALSAFLVAGYTGEGEHAFDAAARKGLGWLKSVQDEEGGFGPRVVSPVVHADQLSDVHVETVDGRGLPLPRVPSDRRTFVYNHAAATIAMVEAYGTTGREAWKASAQGGLDFVALARNPYFAWRYGIKPGDNDTSVAGWMMLPLETARRIDRIWGQAGRPAPFTVDEDAFDGIRAWVEKMTDRDDGRVGYLLRGGPPARPEALVDRYAPDRSEAMTAVGMLARVFAGEDPHASRTFKLGLKLLQKTPPKWNEEDGSIDMIYWHFACLAVHQLTMPRRSGSAPYATQRVWADWLHQVESLLLEHQRKDGDVSGAKGSWDPVGVWGQAGGRVYATALNVLTLLTPVRFEARRP